MDEKQYPFLAVVAVDKKAIKVYLDDHPVIAEAIRVDMAAFKGTPQSAVEDLDLTIAEKLNKLPTTPSIQDIEKAIKAYAQKRGGLGLQPADFIPTSMTPQKISLALWENIGEKVAVRACLWSDKSPTYQNAIEKYDIITSYTRSYCQQTYGRPLYEALRDAIHTMMVQNPDEDKTAEDILKAEADAFHEAIFKTLNNKGLIIKKEKTFFSKEKVTFEVKDQSLLELAVLAGINVYRDDQQSRLALLVLPLRASSPSISIPSSSESVHWRSRSSSDEKRITPTDGVMPTPSSSSVTLLTASNPSPQYSSSGSTGSNAKWVSVSRPNSLGGTPSL